MNKLEASLAKLAYEFKNVKQKLMNTNQNIKFNKTCLNMQLVPKYIQVRINCNSFVAKRTKKYAEQFWIKNEIKSLYRKKSMLNILLYKKHLEFCSKVHPALQQTILCKIDQLINSKTYTKRKILDKKLKIY